MRSVKIIVCDRLGLSPDMLKHLGASPGDRVEVTRLPDARIELRVATPRPARQKGQTLGKLSEQDMAALIARVRPKPKSG
jgi:hypothetical protein